MCYILPYFCSTFLFFVLHATFVLQKASFCAAFFSLDASFFRLYKSIQSCLE
nr:MAG TPA: hypothetical protein [Caudoviricetes sp.]